VALLRTDAPLRTLIQAPAAAPPNVDSGPSP